MRPTVLSFVFFISLSLNAKVIDRVLAVVNEQMVTKSELTSFEKDLKTSGLVDNALLSFYNVDEIRKSEKLALDYLIDTKIIDSVIDKRGINVPIEAVEDEIRSIAEKSGASKAQLIASLKKQGVKYSDYQHFVKTSMERQNLLKSEISSKIKISEDDVANYYIQNQKDADALVFEYQLAHILFVPKDGDSQGARERAKDVLQKLNKGESFNALAAKYSEDPRFSQGGLFGLVRAGEIVPALERSLKGLKEGDVTQVVEMPDGFHIFKVLDRNLVASSDFQQKRRVIENRLFSEIFYRQYKTWIDDQRKSAFLKIHGPK